MSQYPNVAAKYPHTIPRSVLDGYVPDPQLHSHVTITSAIRDDGKLVAVASHPLSARELLGAYYHSASPTSVDTRIFDENESDPGKPSAARAIGRGPVFPSNHAENGYLEPFR